MFKLSRMQHDTQRARDVSVNWMAYLTKKIITVEEFECLVDMEESENTYLYRSFDIWTKCMLTMLVTMKDSHIFRHLFVKFDDILSAHRQEDFSKVLRTKRVEQSRIRIDLFHQYAMACEINVWSRLLSLLKVGDVFIRRLDVVLIAKLATASDHRMPSEELHEYMAWINEQLLHSQKDELDVGPCENLEYISVSLQHFFLVVEYRKAFALADYIGNIIKVLSTPMGNEVHYQFIYGLWLLSFSGDVANKFSKYNTIVVCVQIFCETVRLKVHRIILAFFRNLLELSTNEEIVKFYCHTMIRHHVQPLLDDISNSPARDDDVNRDTKYLLNRLHESEKDLSSFAEYANELRSGHLEWSPMHKSKVFWRKNANRLNDRGNELLKILLNYIDRRREPVILRIALHDLGQYIAYSSRGRAFLESMEVRPMIVRLLTNQEPSVCHEALLCMQKLLVAIEL